MPLKAKAIAFSVAVLLAGAGGVYAFMPTSQQSASDASKTAAPMQDVATAVATDPVSTLEEQASQGAVAPETDINAAPKQPKNDRPVNPPSTKLTRQQLMPPPATEDEKLQKAAEMESNF